MLRWKGSVVAVSALVALGTVAAIGAARAGSAGAANPSEPARLTLFYTPPVLARAGERVRVPVDLVCATPRGQVCSASLSVTEQTAGRAARTIDAGPTHQRSIDLTRPARRAAGGGGSVGFSFLARSGSTSLAYPAGGSEPLRVYVTSEMPNVAIPDIPFGQTATGRTVLYLPWGSGPTHAGLQPGHESPTLGPASFDVDAHGRISLLDSEQDRLAVFRGGRLIRQTRLPLSSDSDIATSSSGVAFIGDRSGAWVTVRRASGHAVTSIAAIASPLLGQVRTASGRAFVNVLPEDSWVAVDRPGGPRTVGLPNGNGLQLLRSGGEHRIRVGAVVGGLARDAVELTTRRTLGEVALAQVVRPGDYWIVAHPYRERPTPADQFEAIHVKDGAVVQAFAIEDRSFADQRPLNRFRLVGRYLYQLTTSPDGLRVVRFDIGRES